MNKYNPLRILRRRYRDLLAEAKRTAGPVDHSAALARELPAAEQAYQRDQVPTYRTLAELEQAERLDRWRRDAYLEPEILADLRAAGGL